MRADVLRCPTCGGAVALGDGDAAICHYCQTSVPLPEPLRKLRDAERDDQEARAAAARLFQSLGKPPNILLRMLGWPGLPWLALLLLAFTMVLILRIDMAILLAVERNFHVVLDDVLGAGRMRALVAGVALAIVGAWAVAAVYGRRRALGRERLRGQMAAAPPERPGGPATCRECHAPLTIPAGALGVRCSYCRADNLVAVDERWIGKARGDRRGVERSMHEAARVEKGERQLWARRLRNRVVVFGGIGAILGVLALRSPSPWKAALNVSPRQLAPVAGTSSPPPAVDGSDSPVAVDSNCSADGCADIFQLALRRGETLTLERRDDGGPITLFIRGSQPGDPSNRVVDLQKQQLSREQRASFTAPHSGWFFVWLVSSQPMTARLKISLRGRGDAR
jgi:LSD1 subclass zinc finger protein